MKNAKLIDTIVHCVLDHDVKPGDHAGGSGHLSFVSYEVKKVSKKEIEPGVNELTCQYKTQVLTEFTYWPDNPPYVYNHRKKIIFYICNDLSDSKQDKRISYESFIKDIDRMIINYLSKIEMEYGECRAPVRYPPYFFTGKDDKDREFFYCFIDVDLGENETFAFAASDPDLITQKIKIVFKKRFGLKYS